MARCRPRPMKTKEEIRQEIWQLLRSEKAARFPGAEGRIPNFIGAEACAKLLGNLSFWTEAKVVKVNPGVMNMDWLHVRDGSGAEGTNDLTVTTVSQPAAKVGDTVLVTGTITTNKDYGMGYQYPVILEKADVKVEASAAAP